jgi:Uma2 family endonuclease
MNAVLERRHHRFNVSEYYRMAETGILAPDARVELIEGEIVDMAPIGVSHSSIQTRLAAVVAERLGRRAVIRHGLPVHLSDLSEPQPDLAILRFDADFYAAGHPGPQDVLWLIEIADSSLAFDRGAKLAMYARHGIGEVWIVNLRDLRLELHASPGGERYADTRSVGAGESFRGFALPGETWSTAELLGWQ